MPTQKIKDLAFVTGTYTDNSGQTKNRYQNYGGLFKFDNGHFLLVPAWINLAGVPRKEGSDSVLISIFDLRDDQGNRQPTQQTRAPAPARPAPVDVDDDIPFIVNETMFDVGHQLERRLRRSDTR